MKNLLDNLLSIRTNIELPLTISIDDGGTKELNALVDSFQWPYGEKRVVIHQKKLGLINHFMWVGDQTKTYDHVLFLEDDIIVSPTIIDYTMQVIDFYENEDGVAAASLYNPILEEATGTKFYQIQDEYDAYFLQQPYWGHIWYKHKWRKFKEYLKTYEVKPAILPPNVAKWNRSFKKIYIQFLVETNRTVVTPRVSIVTNNGVPGIHSGELYMYQSQIQIGTKRYLFPTLTQSRSKYDCFKEIYPEILKECNSVLANYDFCVDLLGTRHHYDKPYVLTTKPVKNPVMTFSSLMKPTELAVVLNVSGNNGVSLGKAADVRTPKSYIRRRRYNDIKKNYFIGIYAQMYIALDFLKSVIIYIFHWK